MVKINKIIYLLFVILLVLPFAYAQSQTPLWTAEVAVSCQSGVCLEGTQATWQLRITNVGQVPLTIQKIALEDSEGFNIGMVDMSDQLTALNPNQIGTVNVQGILPPPTRGSTLYYKVNYVVDNNIFPESSFRKLVVMPLSDVECQSYNSCKDDELCFNFKCFPRDDFNKSALKELNLPKKNPFTLSEWIEMVLLLAILVFLVIMSVSIIGKKKK